jgi:hypothetical protein
MASIHQGAIMGLDISAYQGLCLIDPSQARALDEDDAYSQGIERIYINKDFPARAADLPNPCFFSACADSFGFRAGSYSSYSRWREMLAEFAQYPVTPGEGHDAAAWSADSGFFWELICFSDCEGAIGPLVSAKLSEDFDTHHAEARIWAATLDQDGDYFIRVYEDFQRAFQMASQGGAVSFH